MKDDILKSTAFELALSLVTAIGNTVHSVLAKKGALFSEQNCTVTGNVLCLHGNVVWLENLMHIINEENYVA